VSPSTAPRRLRPRSGSTPHDAVIADPPPHRKAPFRPALDRRRHHLRRHPRLARNSIAIPLAQHSLVHSRARTQPLSQTDRLDHCGHTSALNPSGARRGGQHLRAHAPATVPTNSQAPADPPGALLPAVSFFGGFRTPALVLVDRSAWAGIRNPSQKRASEALPGSQKTVTAASADGGQAGAEGYTAVGQLQTHAAQQMPVMIRFPCSPNRDRLS
jgi:hypothetical protein